MKRPIFILQTALAAMLLVGCGKDDGLKPTEESVDETTKTVWEQNREGSRVVKIEYATSIQTLTAEYFYDANHRLVKHTKDSRLENTNWLLSEIYYGKTTSDFRYEDGRLSGITTRVQERNDYRNYDYDYQLEASFQYNAQGQQMAEGRNLVYDEQGRLISTYAYYLGDVFYKDELVYDETGNVIKHILPGPEYDMIEQPIVGSYQVWINEFEYDEHPKPNFGLGDFITFSYGHPDFEPLPYVTLANLARSLSKNNMTKAIQGGEEWVYTYNEEGLPLTIETIWGGIPTSEPMILTLTYQKIEAGK